MTCLNTLIFTQEYKHPTQTTLALSLLQERLCQDETDHKNEWGKKTHVMIYNFGCTY